ncbi:uncharacterized protein Z520_06971 [Fonsecaea multimorphosa CBS 102226]|uniref:Uncharacterized protein n=1 Tax=Fonsecaea multimorphosa CBS 102226 TaxID=1442371 RepID=A0A0D2K329_9EURO|nr:uncharacterized protein Z520_06971 [Fonsecaea multimorphosa CBS 102226]KIX97519.1 hypothetical protein Z520_06971 [Fonsecaea multimorphosa CBS 102226]OAL23480.1 hypothetical protein AYO22_06530 [Fonsecaea multimorphosa]
MANGTDCGRVSTPPQGVNQPCAADHAYHKQTLTAGERAGLLSSPHIQIKPELQAVLDWLRNAHSRDSFDKDAVDRVEFPLPVDQYEQFKELEEVNGCDFAYRKHDFDPDAEILAIRMQGLKHELIAEDVKALLGRFIAESQKHADPSVAAFASSLRALGSSDLKYPSMICGHPIVRNPDFSFRSKENIVFPVVVGEVAISQSTQDLQSKTKGYIQGTLGRIRTVLCIDVDYPGKKGARFSVWRAKFDKTGKFQGVECDDTVEIRSKDGVKNPDGKVGLVLSLEDFCPARGVTDIAPLKSVTMTLSTNDLYDIIEAAEADQQQAKQGEEAELKAVVEEFKDFKARKHWQAP